MRILVTGGCGFIGSNLVRLLVTEGHTVLNLDKLTYAGNAASLSDLEGNANYSLLVADICNPDAVANAINSFAPDWIMHLAAESHVDRSIDGPSAFVQTNVVGTFNMLQCARSYWQSLSDEASKRFRFLHVSTDEVYGSLSETGLFTESTPYQPHSPYSASKAASDHFARAWHDTYGFPVLVTNCSNNYGPYQFPEKLIPVVILKCLRGEPIPVYGKGENIRDWLYVEDHCRALYTVMERGQIGETYNIGGNNEKKNIDLVHLLCSLMDDLAPLSSTPLAPLGRGVGGEGLAKQGLSRYCDLITFVTDRPGHDLRYAIDASKITRELGWTPIQDHESGFRKTVQWYLDNENWWKAILNGEYQLDRQGLSTGAKA